MNNKLVPGRKLHLKLVQYFTMNVLTNSYYFVVYVPDCQSIISVYPLVLDKALGSEVELNVELTKAPSKAKDIQCSISQSASRMVT